MQHSIVATRHTKCPKLPWMIDFHKTGDVLCNQLKAAFEPTFLQHMASLDEESKVAPKRMTQLLVIIRTKTPVEEIESYLDAGMKVAVIRSHKMGLFETERLVESIRSACDSFSQKIGRVFSLAVAFDICEPQITTGKVPKCTEQELCLEQGEITRLTSNPTYENHSSKDMIFINCKDLAQVVKPGDSIILEGGPRLSALEVAKEIIECLIERTGILDDNLSVSFPNNAIPIPYTEEQEKFLKLAAELQIDMIFIGHHLYEITKETVGLTVSVILKLENSRYLDQFDEIADDYDGVLIDCDQLLQTQNETCFLTQKSITARCNKLGKPCIGVMAVQSMTKSFVFDVANAVLDGVDGVLLQPDAELIESVSILCKSAEMAIYQKRLFDELSNLAQPPMEPQISLAIGTVETAFKCNARAIIVLTNSGKSARLIAKYRPRCPIIAMTRFVRVAKQLMIYKGVIPFYYVLEKDGIEKSDQIFQLGITYGKLNGYIKMGDAVVLAFGKQHSCGFRNSVEVVFASEYDTLIEKTE